MKIVEEEKKLRKFIFISKNEAKKYFGNDEFILKNILKIQDILKCKLCQEKIELFILEKEIVQFKEDIKS